MTPELIVRYLPAYLGFVAVWIAAWTLASVVHRRARGRPILFTGVPNATFVETDASGCSNRTWYTKLGGANRCLVVAVARERLIVCPRFPFNLMFLPDVYGLEHDVSVDHIARIDVAADRPNRIRLAFRDPMNNRQDVTLRLRDGRAFIAALGPRAASVANG